MRYEVLKPPTGKVIELQSKFELFVHGHFMRFLLIGSRKPLEVPTCTGLPVCHLIQTCLTRSSLAHIPALLFTYFREREHKKAQATNLRVPLTFSESEF